MRRNRPRFPLLGAAAVALVTGCGHDALGPALGTSLQLRVDGLRALDAAREGHYEVWFNGDAGIVSGGRFDATLAGGTTLVTVTVPVDRPRRASITIEPPGDDDDAPSRYVIFAGDFRGSTATLSIEGSITDGRNLEPNPGAHSLFTSSNNFEMGYPSFENAGLWLFTLLPSQNVHKSREVKLTPVKVAWTYEGWIVHHYGRADAIWISLGKYRPDELGLLSSRDNTGSGPFSGDIDYVNGGIEDVPGDEWTTNPFGLPFPPELTLPLALDSVDAAGQAVWYHVITAEPVFEENEPLRTERPFLPLYANPIGAGGPGVPRIIHLIEPQPSAIIAPVR